MYIVDKEVWSKIHAFLLKSFRTSSSAVLDDGRMGIRVNAGPEFFGQITRHVMPENAELGEQGTQFEYVPEKDHPIYSEPEHIYSADIGLVPYIGKVAVRYLYNCKAEDRL